MRERMRGSSRGRARELFDLKQDRGGIADIEFIAQYWVLRSTDSTRRSRNFADTIRQLESVGSAALVDHRVIDRLVDAYRATGEAAHHLSLEQRPGRRGCAGIRGNPVTGRGRSGSGDGRGRRPGAAYNHAMTRTGDRHPDCEREPSRTRRTAMRSRRRTSRSSCPMPSMSLWNSHPRVYLPIEATGCAKCPYCSAEFVLKR